MSAYEKPTKNNKKLFVITIIIAAVFLVAVVVTLNGGPTSKTSKKSGGKYIRYVWGRRNQKFAQITGDHVGEQSAIVFDDKLICAAILCTGKLPLELEVKKIY